MAIQAMTVGVGVFSLSFLLKQTKAMKIRAIIIIDAHGDYIVHGTSEQTPAEMFKAIQPLWGFDPSTEDVHFIEVEVPIPGREQDQNAPETDAG